MSKEEEEAILQYNKQQYSRRFSRSISEYTIETKEILVNRTLAEQLHNVFITFIMNHVNKDVPNISRGGYTAIFRCVVGNEVWNFSTKNPKGKFKELTNICNQIVNDVRENEAGIDENKYITLLNDLVNKE